MPSSATPLRLFVAGLATETNTFAAAPTGLKAWDVVRPAEVPFERHPWREPLERVAARHGVQAVLGLTADAQPDGPTVRSAYEGLRDELLADLRQAQPVQAVLLLLHGAMVAEGYPDCEGDLIDRVRAIVGPDVPIGVELDLHCHFTERMRTGADVVIAYKEYPHTDVLERFDELVQITLEAAHGRVRPVTAVHDCRMVGFWHTTREPMISFVRHMQSLEGRDGILSVSFGHGFPYGDVPESGAKVWVVADGDEARAAAVARDLGQRLWSMRHQTGARQTGLPLALDRLAAHDGRAKPIVVADIADNPGGGASSDATFVLRGLVERSIGNVALAGFWDLGALRICQDAGVGARLALRLGGKCGPASGDPVDLRVTVRALRDEHVQTIPGFPPSACGAGAWVSTEDGLDIVLIGKRVQVYALDMFTGLGVDLAGRRGIVVKSSQHFHAQFAPLASEVLYVETPGLLRTDFQNLDYRQRSLNYWPRVDDPWQAP